ncbi:dephospho-CoA kinase [Allobaculum sp. JKK-2023]|uniref:dephospho-CoA kinase n=1 Tax=Allobaculum sp. JKK-2023 TaxID=3108943 RepID=UPI002B060DC3|nr:dephospho-CoA kinase [Allobaculum sp. JKK-2023]
MNPYRRVQTPESRQTVIGITGTMGSGKSMAASILKERIPAIDCDAINASLQQPGKPGWQALEKAGLLYVDQNGQMDRQKLADVLFEDPSLRKTIEGLLQPLIIEAMDQWIESQQGLCAVEVPLLFECSLQNHFDQVWTVCCDRETALKRLQEGRNIPCQEAKRRLALQMEPERKAKLSDVVLFNDNTPEELRRQINQHLDKLMEKDANAH